MRSDTFRVAMLVLVFIGAIFMPACSCMILVPQKRICSRHQVCDHVDRKNSPRQACLPCWVVPGRAKIVPAAGPPLDVPAIPPLFGKRSNFKRQLTGNWRRLY